MEHAPPSHDVLLLLNRIERQINEIHFMLATAQGNTRLDPSYPEKKRKIVCSGDSSMESSEREPTSKGESFHFQV